MSELPYKVKNEDVDKFCATQKRVYHATECRVTDKGPTHSTVVVVIPDIDG